MSLPVGLFVKISFPSSVIATFPAAALLAIEGETLRLLLVAIAPFTAGAAIRAAREI